MTRGGDEDIETRSLKHEAHKYKRGFSFILYMHYIILVSKGKFIWYDKGGINWYWGELWKFLDTWKGGSERIVGLGGGSENLYTSKPTGGGGGT